MQNKKIRKRCHFWYAINNDGNRKKLRNLTIYKTHEEKKTIKKLRRMYKYADVQERRKHLLKLKKNMQPEKRKETKESESKNSKKGEEKKT